MPRGRKRKATSKEESRKASLEIARKRAKTAKARAESDTPSSSKAKTTPKKSTRKARLTTKKGSKGKGKAEQELVPDITHYEVEKIVNHSLDARKCSISYTIKWKGYKTTSAEIEARMLGYANVVRYWADLRERGKLKENEEYMHNGVMYTNDRQGAVVKFTIADCVHDKEYMKRNEHNYDLRYLTLRYKDEDERDKMLDAYEDQMEELFQVVRTIHPHVAIENECDMALPPPIRSISFFCEQNSDEEMICKVHDKSGALERFNLNEPRHHSLLSDVEKNTLLEMFRKFTDSRYGERLARYMVQKSPLKEWPRLIMCRGPEEQWYIDLDEAKQIPAGSWIMPVGGIERSVECSADALYKEGELTAVTMFYRLPNARTLDIRHRHGFAKYIEHSCAPNCEMVPILLGKRVNEDGDIVDYFQLIVRAIRQIHQESLTIDKFKLPSRLGCPVDLETEEEAELRHAEMIDNHVDHAMCTCEADTCRRIVYEGPKISKDNLEKAENCYDAAKRRTMKEAVYLYQQKYNRGSYHGVFSSQQESYEDFSDDDECGDEALESARLYMARRAAERNNNNNEVSLSKEPEEASDSGNEEVSVGEERPCNINEEVATAQDTAGNNHEEAAIAKETEGTAVNDNDEMSVAKKTEETTGNEVSVAKEAVGNLKEVLEVLLAKEKSASAEGGGLDEFFFIHTKNDEIGDVAAGHKKLPDPDNLGPLTFDSDQPGSSGLEMTGMSNSASDSSKSALAIVEPAEPGDEYMSDDDHPLGDARPSTTTPKKSEYADYIPSDCSDASDYVLM